MMLSIIIPTKNRDTVFYKTLAAAYKAIKNCKAEIIVVNDSKTNQLKLDDIYKDKVTVFDNPKSGVASARNYGVTVAKSSNLLFLDDDILICENNINYIISFLNKYPNSCLNLNWEYPQELLNKSKQNVLGRFFIKYQLNSLKGWRKGSEWSEELFEVTSGASYCLALSKQVFNSIKGYNETFPHAGFEDFEFNKRIHAANFKIFIEPNEVVYHNEEDKLDLNIWMQRNYNTGVTRKIAVELGNTEVKLTTPKIKQAFYKIMWPFKDVIFNLILFFYKVSLLDFFSFKLIHLLTGLFIFKGYHRNK